MFTLKDIRDIISNIKFRDWDICVHQDFDPTNDRPYLQLHWKAPNNDDLHGPVESQISRKWWLSYHMCENEIVRTAHKAIMTAMEHEVNEQFTFRGQRIFDPHMDYSKLAQMIQLGYVPNNNRE